MNQEATRPSTSPTFRATDELLKIRTRMTTATARTAMPTAAAPTRAGSVCPVITRSASATAGSASFVKLFQMPVTPTNRAVSAPVNPHELRIAYVIAIATAPPAGTVLATDVPVCVATADRPSRNPGSAAWLASQYV